MTDQQNMKREQINQTIARACGWKSKEETNGVPWLWFRTKADFTIEDTIEPPDYCNDLNAMHDAEKTLDSPELFRGYYFALYDITKSTLPIGATAKQRAKAFLLTIGKWKGRK